ncbi:MAG: Ig-like domain-containing protein [Verrucomicrobiota bacterium JB025]|nr:Ig-like domain-containing protein [Verrucomicrobiota bacterium JB025]
MKRPSRPPHSIPILLSAATLMAAANVQADTINFLGGNLATASNWDGGVKPGAGDVGTINVDGTLNIGNTLGGWINGDPELIVDNGATITCSGDWGHTLVLSSTVNDGTIIAGDDIFANSSLMIFNTGSTASAADDYEANGGGTLTINGGTHTAGDTFGAQTNSTLNLTGGTITAGQFRVAATGTITLDGTAILSGDGDTSLLEGTVAISSTWTGSWTISTLTGTDWETVATSGTWTLDGTTIDATVFAENFEVTNGGTTLSPVSPPSPPTLVSTDPANGATGVVATNSLVATFDEAIALGTTGDVTITNLTTSSTTVISLPGPDADGTLTVSGSALTIDPAAGLDAGDQYAIQISSTVVEDLDGNTYDGISDTTTWSFTTDGTPPALLLTSPYNGQTDVLPATNLQASFTEAIALGTGTITIRNLTTSTDIEISVPGTDPDGTVTISGINLTIDPAVDLTAGDQYSIEIDSTAIEDLSGNHFAGIFTTDTYPWTFTTDASAPTLVSTDPADGDTNIVTSTNLTATFSEDIALGTTGTITLRNLTTSTDVEISVAETEDPDGTLTIDGTVLTIDPALALAAGNEFAVEISAGAIVDLAGNAYAGILSTDDPNWSFTTDGTAPATIATGPLTGASEVATFSSLSLTFDEDVQAGTGTITIHLASDGSVFETIDVTSASITISNGKVTILPTSGLTAGTSYYVTVTDGAFTDASGNAFAGISDSTTWTFTTESGDKILFADTFNRADDSDLNAADTGKSGVLAPLDWAEVLLAADPLVQDNALHLGETSAGGGFSVLYPDHNFTDTAITLGNGFSVSVDLVNAASTGSTRFMGIAVGQSKTEIDAWTANNPNSFDSDFFVGIDPTGTEELKVFVNASEVFQTGFSLTPPQTLSVDFTLTSFASGAPVSYEVFVDGASITTGSFNWSGAEENYIALFSNYTQTQAIMDNFVVRSNVAFVEDALQLEIATSGTDLEFSWNSLAGMQYHLLSSTDLSTPVSSWAPYNDGVTTYENIVSTGTGTQTLTGVMMDGTRRFFALSEEEVIIEPLFETDFETDNGGFTATGTNDEWEYGMPNSDNNYAVALDSSNSTNCWGTNLGDGSTDMGFIDDTADSILRSPDIDLTAVTDAVLEFSAAYDTTSNDTFEILIRDASTGTLIDTLNPIPLAVESTWTPLGPFSLSAAAGSTVYLEFHYQGADPNFIGVYIDDVTITPTSF